MNTPTHFGPVFKTIGNTVDSIITQQLQASELTSSQMFLLHFLSRHAKAPIYQKDVEDALELSHATVAGIISRLESKGFIQLVTSEQDKRCKQIIVTEKAKKLDEESGRVIRNAEKKLLAGFSEDEVELLRDFCKRILNNLGIKLPPRPSIKED